jgi:hypothetical protein
LSLKFRVTRFAIFSSIFDDVFSPNNHILFRFHRISSFRDFHYFFGALHKTGTFYTLKYFSVDDNFTIVLTQFYIIRIQIWMKFYNFLIIIIFYPEVKLRILLSTLK